MKTFYCFVAALFVLTGTVAAQQRPNILFIAVDDLRPELGCYGSKIVRSPNIDRLAARGLVFDRAYCQQAVCSPSRSSLLTGTRPDTTKVWDLETHFRKALPDVITLPQHFKDNGYFVQGMGKIYHPGFDDPPGWSVPWQGPGRKAKQYGLEENRAMLARKRKEGVAAGKKGKELANYVRGPAFEAAEVPDETFADGVVAEMAIAALKEAKERNTPFFLAVGFARPHLPFVAPKKYWDMYDPAKIELATNSFRPKGAPAYAVQPGGEMRVYEGIPKGHIADDLARQLKHGYYASVSYMDAQLGRVLDQLESLGLADKTIIVLWGDHGWKLGEHDAWCKHTNVEDDTRAPLILSLPGMKSSGKHTGALVEFVDVYPTLTELAGLPLPKHLEGVSAKALVDEPNRAWKTAAFSQYPRNPAGKSLMGYTMRTDRYRFTRWVQRNDPSKIEAVELYDHSVDPQENQNLAEASENKDLVGQLHRRMNAGWKGNLPK
ncbi:MAG TPA: sulfatase [Tepidisphaeraceae bacterium]|jgi:arylsulfatase A-like enzyme|nr:sulfatase [Tepidisphaeraceae bacterium]